MSSRDAHYAMQAWQQGRRRRGVVAVFDRAADATMAAGAMLLANAIFGMNFGVPAGKTGSALGVALLCAGLAWISRHRAQGSKPQDVAYARMNVPAPVQVTRPVDWRRAA